MDTGGGNIVDKVQHLLMEEAHLIGQEVQDALGKDQAHRLHEVCAVLDELEALLRQRPQPRGHRLSATTTGG